MVKRIGGLRRKTRDKLSKNVRERGKLRITEFIKKLNIGDKVVLKIEPSYQKGLFHARFYGKVGTVIGKRGKSYEVLIKDGKKEKRLFIPPIHLKKI